MTKNRKFLIKVFVITIIFFIGLLGTMIFLHELYQNNFRYQSQIDCFAGAAVRCGSVDNTKEEILEEIDSLHLSLDEAREIILKAQHEGVEYHNELRSKDILSEHEKYVLDNKWKRENYFERVLQIIENEKNK